MVEHIERAMERFFRLPAGQAISFDTDALLRTDFAARVEGYSRVVQSGVVTVNEARAKMFGLGPVEHGDQPIVQQQMVPLGSTEPAAAPELPTPEPDPAATEVQTLALLRDYRSHTA